MSFSPEGVIEGPRSECEFLTMGDRNEGETVHKGNEAKEASRGSTNCHAVITGIVKTTEVVVKRSEEK